MKTDPTRWRIGRPVTLRIPLNQAWLSQIPLRTLANSYGTKEQYEPQAALVEAVEALCDDKLAESILEDVTVFQDLGLDGMEEDQKRTLIEEVPCFRITNRR